MIGSRLRRLLACSLVVVAASGCASTHTGTAHISGAIHHSVPSGRSGLVTVDGVSFRMPTGLRTIDTDAFDCSCASGSAAFTSLADRLGKTPDEVVAMVQQADLFAISDGGALHGVTQTLNVTTIASATLPTEDQLRLGMAPVGAHVEHFAQSTSDAGDVVSMDFLLSLNGQSIYGRSMLVRAGGRVVDISVAAGSSKLRADLGDRVLATVTEPPT